MATIFGNGIDLKDTELLNALLTNVKLTEGTDAPEPGDLRLVGDVPHYVNALGVVRPVHEDSLTSISGGSGPITFEINGRTATAAIAPADATNPGTLSPEYYALLAGATTDNIDGTLIKRGFSDGESQQPSNLGNVSVSNLRFGGNLSSEPLPSGEGILLQGNTATVSAVTLMASDRLQAGAVQTGNVDLTFFDPQTATDTNAVPKGYVDTAIASSIDALDTGVSAVTGIGAIAATPPDTDGVVSLSIAPADATNPGTLSSEHYNLLAGATQESARNSLVIRDENQTIFSKFLVASDAIDTSYLSSGSVHSTLIYGTTQINTPNLVCELISVNGGTITGLNTVGSDDSSAASVVYVRDKIQTATQDLAASIGGRDFKNSVRYAYKINVPLTGAPPAQGGIAVTPNQSVLLLNQTNAAENGAYNFDGIRLVRRADSAAEFLTAGATYIVEAGDYTGDRYQLATADFVLDQDALTFLDATDQTIGSNGLEQDGRILRVKGIPNQISVTPDGVGISTTYSGGASLTTLGEISQGTWKANVIGVVYGGTGSSTVVGARTNLEVYSKAEVDLYVQSAIANTKYVVVIGDGVATSFVLPHNLGEDIDVTIWENKFPGEKVYTDVSRETANSIRISFGSAPALQSYKVVVKA